MLRAYSFPKFLSEDTAMLKSRFLIVFSQILLSPPLISQISFDIFAATCTGADPCHAARIASIANTVRRKAGSAAFVNRKEGSCPRVS